MAVPNPLPPTAGATVVGGNPPIDLNLTSAAPYSSSSTATAAVPTTSPKLNLPNGLPSPTTAPNASRHRHSLSNAPRPVDLGPGSHPNPTSSMDHHHHHHHHPQPQTTSATSTVDGPYAGYPGGGKGKERAPSPWRTSTDEEKGLSGPAKDGSSRSVLFEGTMNGGRTTAKEAGRMNGGYAGPGGTGTSSEDVLAWASYAVGRLRATFDHASSSSSSSTLRRSPPLSSSRSPLLSPSGLHRPFYPSWPRLPSANRLRHWSTRLSPLLSVLALVYLTYRLVFTVLDSPTTLHLDPTIDPLTFKLLPPGDPTHSISDNPLDAPLAAALAADRAERDALVNAQPFDEPRAFWKGDQGLRDNRPAHRFGCDDGRAGRRKGSLLFLGIFTTPGSLAKRQILRTLFRSDLPPAPTPGEPPLIDLTFVSARPPNDNWRWLLERERDLYGDVEWLEAVPENIDTGKTAHFFKWVSEGAGGRWEGKQGGDSRDPRNGPVGRPQFVMKVDDDGFLAIPNLIKHFQALDCTKNVYWGTSQGSWPKFLPYFRGLAYALSWPLVEWIGTSGMSFEAAIGIEDARVGAWLTELDAQEDPVEWVDVGWKMGDWDQMEIDQDTVGLHWLKLDEWVPMVKRKLLVAWEKAGQEYRWDYHLDPNRTVTLPRNRADVHVPPE